MERYKIVNSKGEAVEENLAYGEAVEEIKEFRFEFPAEKFSIEDQ